MPNSQDAGKSLSSNYDNTRSKTVFELTSAFNNFVSWQYSKTNVTAAVSLVDNHIGKCQSSLQYARIYFS